MVKKELKLADWVKTRKCWKCGKYEEKERGNYCSGKRRYLKNLLHDDDECKHFEVLVE